MTGCTILTPENDIRHSFRYATKRGFELLALCQIKTSLQAEIRLRHVTRLNVSQYPRQKVRATFLGVFVSESALSPSSPIFGELFLHSFARNVSRMYSALHCASS